jgi:GxxExxY protein
MEHAFAIHQEFGRLFDEAIYKRELAARMAGVMLEEPVDVVFEGFSKRYLLDVLVGDGAVFEFKAVETLISRHEAQLLNYLLLLDLGHGKLVNVRPKSVVHRFVNTTLSTAERREFRIVTDCWQPKMPGAEALVGYTLSFLKDLGTGLDVTLYEELLTHLLGGFSLQQEIPVKRASGPPLGSHRFRMAAPRVAWKLTTFQQPDASFASHCRKMLNHTSLEAILWANIALHEVRFTTIARSG